MNLSSKSVVQGKLRDKSPVRAIVATALVLAIHIIAAVLLTWPAAKHIGWGIPAGNPPVGTVPMFNTWTIWWNAESWSRGFGEYWNAPIFYPAQGSFALSEPQPFTALLAPITKIWGPLAAYSIYLLVSLTGNGLSAYWVLRQLNQSRYAAILGGLLVQATPIALHNIRVVQLLVMWPEILCIGLLWRVSIQPSIRNGIGLGIAATLSIFTCLHHSLTFGLPLLVAAPLLLRKPQMSQRLRSLMVAVVLFGIVSGPYLISFINARQGIAPSHTADKVTLLSASLSDWAQPARNWQAGDGFPLWPGSLVLLCSLFALRTQTVNRRFLLFATTVLGLSFALSLAGQRSLLGVNLWDLLSDTIPPLRGIRSVYRFAYTAQVVLMLAAAMGCEFLLRLVASEANAVRKSALATFSGFVIVGLIYELRPQQSQLLYPPNAAVTPDWIRYLTDNSREDEVVLCLPTAANGSEAESALEARWMLYQCQHGRPLVNGYSASLPRTALYRDLRELGQSELSTQQIKTLQKAGVHLLVIPNTDIPSRSPHALFRTIFTGNRMSLLRLKERF